MVYQAGGLTLEVVQEVFCGRVNDVVTCRDTSSLSELYYTVLVIRDRGTAKRLLAIYESAGDAARETYVRGMTWRDCFLMVYPYRAARPVGQFFRTEVDKLSECEALCMNIVTECIASGVPYPILYLQLAQEQVHIQRDYEVYFGYKLDLAELSGGKGEQECASLCAKKLFLLLNDVSTERTASYRLLEMKNRKEGYLRFTDLYKDLKAAAIPLEKEHFFARVKAFFSRNQDRMFRGLLVLCTSCGVVALIMILSQIIFSDIPLVRLFVNTMKQIGTESLLN